MGGGGQGTLPLRGEQVCCERGEKAVRALPALDGKPWKGGRDRTHGARGSYSPSPHSLAALLCRGETEAQGGHLHPDCRTRNPGSKKAVCLDSEKSLKEAEQLWPQASCPLTSGTVSTERSGTLLESHSSHRATFSGYSCSSSLGSFSGSNDR